jgi:hypothetical protein
LLTVSRELKVHDEPSRTHGSSHSPSGGRYVIVRQKCRTKMAVVCVTFSGPDVHNAFCRFCPCDDVVAEWSKALDLGSSPQGQEFDPPQHHSCTLLCLLNTFCAPDATSSRRTSSQQPECGINRHHARVAPWRGRTASAVALLCRSCFMASHSTASESKMMHPQTLFKARSLG